MNLPKDACRCYKTKIMPVNINFVKNITEDEIKVIKIKEDKK